MTGRYLHIYLKRSKDVSAADVEKQMNHALDWFKYDRNVWIVYSTADLERWKSRLKPLVKRDGYYFLCEVNVKRRIGWMSKSFWEWLSTSRSGD